MPVRFETAPEPSLAAKAVALPVVGVARLLADLRPMRLRRVLTVLAGRARPATVAEAAAARDVVVAVSSRCAAQQCLQRSIATALLCRLRGAWPEWRTGVRVEPFRAHAWVAVDGEPVGEADDVRTFHTVLAVPAGRAT